MLSYWGLFPNQDYITKVLKHKELPIFITESFIFYRCLSFDEKYYGHTLSELHSGNLRPPIVGNRYSRLFPASGVSYWAESKMTAMAEVKYHLIDTDRKPNNLITFVAYDDASSTFPSKANTEQLMIVDGRELGFSYILKKYENGEDLSRFEEDVVRRIIDEEPDCLAYESERREGGINFIFFDKGFEKLSLREVSLRLGDESGKNRCCIPCAITSDYSPLPENYGYCFQPKARKELNESYLHTEEYLSRKKTIDLNHKKMLSSL